jgi:hypothetical protein
MKVWSDSEYREPGRMNGEVARTVVGDVLVSLCAMKRLIHQPASLSRAG